MYEFLDYSTLDQKKYQRGRMAIHYTFLVKNLTKTDPQSHLRNLFSDYKIINLNIKKIFATQEPYAFVTLQGIKSLEAFKRTDYLNQEGKSLTIELMITKYYHTKATSNPGHKPT